MPAALSMTHGAVSLRSGAQSVSRSRSASRAAPVGTVCSAVQLPQGVQKAMASLPKHAGKVAGGALALAVALSVPELMHAAPALAEIEIEPYEKIAAMDAAGSTLVQVKGTLDEETLKVFYIFALTSFGLGCLWAGSLEDPYYEGPYYRGEGGDGSQHWFYDKADRLEKEARQKMLEELGPRELPVPAEVPKKKTFV